MNASIGDPPRVAVDAAGNFYFASFHSLFKVDGSGMLSLLAGDGKQGTAPNEFLFPYGIAVDRAGNVYVADRDANVIRLFRPNGSQASSNFLPGVTTSFAGTGVAGYSGDGGSAFSAQFNGPTGLAVDSGGNVYVADTGNNVIRKIATNGFVTTVAGNTNKGYGGDGGPATNAKLNGPEGVAVDSAGNLYIADTFNHRIREVSANGAMTTFAATGFPGSSGDNGPAAQANLFLPTDVAVDNQGNVYIADLGNSRIREVSNGIIRTVAGSTDGGQPMNGILAVSARFNGPTGVAVDPAGSVVYLAEGSVGSGSGLDSGDYRIWKFTMPDEVLSAAAGTGARSYSGDGGAAAKAQFDAPAGMTFDLAGNLYIADSRNNRVRKITPAGIVTNVAGNGTAGFSGDGQPAVNAQLNRPAGVAVDAGGVVFIADSGNNRIRRVTRDGLIATIAGNGNAAFFGDGGRAEIAALHNPQGVAVDAADNIYIADTGSQRVRKIGTDDIIQTINSVPLQAPVGLALEGNIVYVADQATGTVVMIGPGGAAQTIASGLKNPSGVAVDNGGFVYIADTGDNQVRKFFAGSSEVIAGTGACCYSGDGGPASAAQLNQPWGLAADQSGNLYIADSGNDVIREVSSGSVSGAVIFTVTNAASNQAGPIVPGEAVSIFGAGLGPNSQVFIGGTSAQVLYASVHQVNAIVPATLAGSTAQIVVQSQGVSANAFIAPVAAAAPGLFTLDASGTGAAVAFPATAAVAGNQLTVFGTGTGPSGFLPVSVTLGGLPALLVGTSDMGSGVLSVTVQVPAGLPPGPVPVILTVGAASSQSGVTITAAGN